MSKIETNDLILEYSPFSNRGIQSMLKANITFDILFNENCQNYPGIGKKTTTETIFINNIKISFIEKTYAKN